jgi:DNA-binding NarL/FixJ family response regulator
MTLRIAIVDDQALLRAGFRKLLEAESDFTVVGEASDGAEAVAMCREVSPDVLLMDIRMPRIDGIEATRRVVSANAAVTVLILTTYDLDEYVLDALRAGASGFLLKDAPPEDLVAGIRQVARGDALLAPSVTRRLIAEFTARPRESPAVDLPALSQRETEVLRLVARGLSNAEIAGELFLGEATVKTHVGSLLAKLGCRDRVQAVVRAYESGLVQPGRGEATGPGAQ